MLMYTMISWLLVSRYWITIIIVVKKKNKMKIFVKKIFKVGEMGKITSPEIVINTVRVSVQWLDNRAQWKDMPNYKNTI